MLLQVSTAGLERVSNRTASRRHANLNIVRLCEFEVSSFMRDAPAVSFVDAFMQVVQFIYQISQLGAEVAVKPAVPVPGGGDKGKKIIVQP